MPLTKPYVAQKQNDPGRKSASLVLKPKVWKKPRKMPEAEVIGEGIDVDKLWEKRKVESHPVNVLEAFLDEATRVGD
jgi:hypothetical protein